MAQQSTGNREQQFVFTGQAVAAAGANLKGFKKNTFPGKAMAVLANIGGSSQSRSRRFCIPGLVEYHGALSTVVGSGHQLDNGQLFLTNVISGIKDFNLQSENEKRAFRGQNMKVALCSEQVIPYEPTEEVEREIKIEIGKDFVFSVNDHKAYWELDPLFDEMNSYTELEKWRKRDPSEAKVKMFHKDRDGYYFYSPVKRILIEGRSPIIGNVIPLPGLGRLHLFEVIRGYNSLRVNLARLVVDREQGAAQEKNQAGERMMEHPGHNLLDSQITVCDIGSNGMKPDDG